MDKSNIGLAFSSGGARGAAHVGVLKVFKRHGIPIHLITGTSIGAMVGGVYAAGISVEEIEKQWLNTDLKKVIKVFKPALSPRGWSRGDEMRTMLEKLVAQARIENLPTQFAALATDLETGEEVIIKEGCLVDAIRASCSVPGLFVPLKYKKRFLVDGGIVNPLPVDITYQLGANIVIGVDVIPSPKSVIEEKDSGLNRLLHGQLLTGKGYKLLADKFGDILPHGLAEPSSNSIKEERENRKRVAPGIPSTLNFSSLIFQRKVLSLKLTITPPDVLIKPQLKGISLGYHRPEEAIEAGERAAEEAIPKIKELVESTGS